MAPPSATSSQVWLITGAGRGLGLGFVRQLLAQPSTTVIAAARKPDAASDLQALAKQHGDRLRLLQLDTSDSTSIKAAAAWVTEHVGRLDVLVNNAAVAETDFHSWDQTDADEMNRILVTNVTGPLLLTAALAPLLRASPGQHKKVVNISSLAGSVSFHADGGRPHIEPWVAHYTAGGEAPQRTTGMEIGIVAYRASKAALNTETLIMARDFAADNITVLLFHPGFVASDMGTTVAKDLGMDVAALLSPDGSAAAVLAVIAGKALKDTGSFLDWEGNIIPW